MKKFSIAIPSSETAPTVEIISTQSASILAWQKHEGPLALARGMERAGYKIEKHDRSSKGWEEDILRKITSKDAPDWFFCSQRLYKPYNTELLTALEKSKTRMLVLDFGLIDHYNAAIFDPRGENAESSIAYGNFDRLSAIPVQAEAIEKELPKVASWSENLRTQAENYIPPDELHRASEMGMAVYFSQRLGDMVLRFDAPGQLQKPNNVAKAFVAATRIAGLVPVIKPHPLDTTWIPKSTDLLDAVLISGDFNENLVAWLMLNAKAVVLVNSTLVFNCLALDVPVLQLGRGWCSGNNVVFEGDLSCLDDFYLFDRFDKERRHRFLAMLLSRQRLIDDLENPKVVISLLNFFSNILDDTASIGSDEHRKKNQNTLGKSNEEHKNMTKAKTKRKCPSCGATNVGEHDHCLICQASLTSVKVETQVQPTQPGERRCTNPQCGQIVPEGKKFCTLCGTPVAAGVRGAGPPELIEQNCPKCSQIVPEGKIFCTACGTPVK